MKGQLLVGVAFAVSYALASAAEARAGDVIKVGQGDGCSVSYVEAVPKPGAKLPTGVGLEFRVRVRYTLSAADGGRILLVFQDGRGAPLVQGEQAQVHLESGSGEAALTGSVVIPTGTKRVKLFVPMMPEGVAQTTAAIMIQYAVK